MNLKQTTKRKTDKNHQDAMKEGWQIYKLEDICTIYDKLRKPISKKDRVSGIYPYYGASCVQDYVNDYLFDGRYVLIGEDGAKWGSGEDTAYIVEGKFWVNNHAHIIQCNNGIVDTFIYYYFNHLDLTKLVAGAIIPKLTQETLRSMEIPIPSSSEQQRIVALLDAEFAKIDALKANAEKNLQNAKDLFQAALKKELEPKEGWKRIPFKEITTEIGDGLHGTPKYTENGSYFFVNGNNFESGIIEIKANTKRVDNNEFEKYKLNLNETTVLLSINGTVGKTAFYNGEPIILGKSACYINVLPSIITKEYVRYYLLSDGFKDYARKHSRQATIINLGLKEIRQMAIPFPHSLLDQQSIVARLDVLNEKCKTLQANYEKTLSLCDDLKQALLRKAFNGEI